MATPDNFEFLITDDERSTASSEEASDMSEGSELEVDVRASSPASEPPPSTDLFQRSTASKISQLNEIKTFEAVKQTTAVMDATGINLPIYLDAVSWGNKRCTEDASIRYQRSALLHSRELPGILCRWRKPPRSSARMTRPAGATKTLNEFAIATTIDLLTKELKELGPMFSLSAGEDVNSAHLTEMNITSMMDTMKTTSPKLWSLLTGSLSTDRRNKEGIKKSSDKVVFTIISMAVYARSHRYNRLPKLLAIYLKFRGISAKGFDTLHAMGLTMSHKWACEAVEHMSKQAMKEVAERMEKFPWVISYDNVNIPFRVFSQRLDNQGDLGHGTAAMVYIKRDAPQPSNSLNKMLKEQRAQGIKDPLTEVDIFDLEQASASRIDEQMKYTVLRMLLDSPEFDLKSYEDRKSDFLKAPPPIDPLPTGPDHTTLQFLLGTVDIPEVSYEDSSRLVNEWLGQLGFKTLLEQVKLSVEKVVTWVGDQLTVDRLRRIFTRRAGDDNSFDRLDFSIFIFGWLHLQMAFANTLHKQYLGTAGGRGLKQAFVLLNKKNLHTVRTQGPFHHDLVEALYEVANAHIRQDWLQVANVKSLAELRNRSAEELQDLATHLVDGFASSKAMDDMDRAGNPDAMRRQVTMFNRDVLHYIVLDQAMKSGDVGLMEAMLPTLLYRFISAGSGNYAKEVMELLQGLHRKWPPELSKFV
ncbi:hypothetical protein H1R20_g15670, partial [Candolleomyces eurysporus]